MSMNKLSNVPEVRNYQLKNVGSKKFLYDFKKLKKNQSMMSLMSQDSQGANLSRSDSRGSPSKTHKFFEEDAIQGETGHKRSKFNQAIAHDEDYDLDDQEVDLFDQQEYDEENLSSENS